MNPHDKKNLDFLLYSSPEIIHEWYSKVSEDDIQYALEILAEASAELDMLTDFEIPDCIEAKTLLSKFTLKGPK